MSKLGPTSIEVEICEIEIARLKKIAMTGRGLTLDETKQLESLVKTLYLARGQPTDTPDAIKELEKAPLEDLLKIAESSKKSE
jgi:hypothetical protein